MNLKCSNCGSTNIKKYKVKHQTGDWHVKGICNCGRQRYLNKMHHYSSHLPEIKTKASIRESQTELF